MSTFNPYRVKKDGPLFEEKAAIEVKNNLLKDSHILVETNEKFLRWFHKNAQQLMSPLVYNLLCTEFETQNPTVKLKRFI